MMMALGLSAFSCCSSMALTSCFGDIRDNGTVLPDSHRTSIGGITLRSQCLLERGSNFLALPSHIRYESGKGFHYGSLFCTYFVAIKPLRFGFPSTYTP
jgi:hypothetical protein